MWKKIKKWFGLLDLNKDGKVTVEDFELAKTLTEKTVKEANEKINTVNEQITDAVTLVKKHKETVKKVVDQAEDVVATVKSKTQKGRKKK
jgi:Ca2+-binding EF-hand superfamily protein